MTHPLTRAALVCSAAVALVAGAAGTAHAADVTCDFPTIVPMPVPGATLVVGETSAERVVVARWSCQSDDTSATFTMTGTLSEYFWSAGGWRLYDSETRVARSLAGRASVDFAIVEPYAPDAVGTMHYIRFAGSLPNGRSFAWNGELFYVGRV